MSTGILWLRRDLRLTDNPALSAAAAECARLLPVYIHAPGEEAPWQPGAASNWWLHHSLQRQHAALRRLGSRLVMLRAESSLQALSRLIAETGATRVYWNRLYEPWAVARDGQIKRELALQGCEVASYNSALLHEPWHLTKADGTPYKVFTPFWKALLKAGVDQDVQAAPARLPPPPSQVKEQSAGDLGLLPRIPWDAGFKGRWMPGEAGAQQALQVFLEQKLEAYALARDLPHEPGTSGLSPHLHFGEIGPRQLMRALLQQSSRLPEAAGRGGADRFAAELGWREFACNLLYHFPSSAEKPLHTRFDHFPWSVDYQYRLGGWQRGETGIPIVDAGMRELWHDGWMHNRVRMIVASLLTKNLLIPWQEGARWFWDTLLDADLASNTLGWQWVAGCGADAAPYFRIFNPVLQGRRFDPDGAYVRRWLPELRRLPERFVHAPWEASESVLMQAGVRLGEDYPRPIVDLKVSRVAALAAFDQMKRRNGF